MTFASFVANTLVGFAEVIRENDRRSFGSQPPISSAQQAEWNRGTSYSSSFDGELVNSLSGRDFFAVSAALVASAILNLSTLAEAVTGEEGRISDDAFERASFVSGT